MRGMRVFCLKIKGLWPLADLKARNAFSFFNKYRCFQVSIIGIQWFNLVSRLEGG